MTQFFIVLNQIGVFALLIAVGVIARRTRILTDGALGAISQLTVKVALPAFIFSNTVYGTNREDLLSALPILPSVFLMYAILLTSAYLLARLFRLQGNRNHVFRFCMIFGNAGLIGLPLANEIYPGTAIICFSLFTIIDQFLLWTYGVTLTFDTSGERQKVRFGVSDLKKILLSPALISIVVSFVFVIARLDLPSFIDTAIVRLGNLLSPMGLLYMGAMLYWKDIRAALRRKELFAGIGVKMIAIPILIFFLLRAFGLSNDMSGTMSVIAGLPSIMISMMLVKNNGSDHEYCIGLVMLTTVACLITYPVVSILIALI